MTVEENMCIDLLNKMYEMQEDFILNKLCLSVENAKEMITESYPNYYDWPENHKAFVRYRWSKKFDADQSVIFESGIRMKEGNKFEVYVKPKNPEDI